MQSLTLFLDSRLNRPERDLRENEMPAGFPCFIQAPIRRCETGRDERTRADLKCEFLSLKASTRSQALGELGPLWRKLHGRSLLLDALRVGSPSHEQQDPSDSWF